MFGRNRRAGSGNTSGRVVPLSTVLLAVALAAVLSAGGTAAVDRLVLDAPAGSEGPAGPSGDSAELDPEVVWEQIEGDPERLAAVLDPAPSDLDDRDDELAGEVEQVASDLDSLCSSLRLTDALSAEVLSCP